MDRMQGSARLRILTPSPFKRKALRSFAGRRGRKREGWRPASCYREPTAPQEPIYFLIGAVHSSQRLAAGFAQHRKPQSREDTAWHGRQHCSVTRHICTALAA